MVQELFKCDFNFSHVPGKQLYIADAHPCFTIDDKRDQEAGSFEAGSPTINTILTASYNKTTELQEADAELMQLEVFI